MHKALEDVAPAAKKVREFLESLAELCAKRNKLLKWVTPLGLPVLNLAYEPEMATLKTRFRGGRKRVDLALRDSDRVDKDDAVRAVTANFTHSMDACHLMMVATVHYDYIGIDMAAIHDCFACLAPHATIFNKAIRGSFFSLYQFNSVLAHISLSTRCAFPGVDVPQAPPFGDLNLKQVHDSTFFVS
jgi:DNA-directed RNA polymerase